MPFVVQLTDDAADDLEEIVDYFSRQDAPRRVEPVLERIEQAFRTLSAFPEHGSYPRELSNLGVREYRQLLFKPYRMIYRVIDDTVYVLVNADGRRDMRGLLERRLLDA